jgi:hypothetical protein
MVGLLAHREANICEDQNPDLPGRLNPVLGKKLALPTLSLLEAALVEGGARRTADRHRSQSRARLTDKRHKTEVMYPTNTANAFRVNQVS